MDINQFIPTIGFAYIDATMMSSLMNTVVTVQATIITLSIALIALLSGATKETAYGMPFSRYIIQEKPKILKYKSIVITELLLVIAGFIALTFSSFIIVAAIFLISIILVIVMSIGIFEIFKGSLYIKHKIKEYYLNEFAKGEGCETTKKQEQMLYSIRKDIHLSLENNDFTSTREDIEMLEEVFEKLLGKNMTVDSSLFKLWQDVVSESFKAIIRKKNPDLIYLVIQKTNSMLKACNNYNNIHGEKNYSYLLIPQNIMYFYFQVLHLLDLQPMVELNFDDFITNMYNNICFIENEQKNNHFLADFSHNFYVALFVEGSENWNWKYKQSINIQLHLILTEGRSCNQYKHFQNKKVELMYVELRNYMKTLIDHKEYWFLQEFFFNSIQTCEFSNLELEYRLIIIIYMYYLVEGQFEGKVKDFRLQKGIRTIIRNNTVRILGFLEDRLSCVSNQELMQGLKDNLGFWEWGPKYSGVWIQEMPTIIEEFFIFYFLKSIDNPSQIKSAAFQFVKNKEPYEQIEQTKIRYRNYQELFYDNVESDEALSQKVNMLRDAMA